jgi:hypothetical protein
MTGSSLLSKVQPFTLSCLLKQAFGYYGLQASLFELRPDRLLTSLARHSPQGDGGCPITL